MGRYQFSALPPAEKDKSDEGRSIELAGCFKNHLPICSAKLKKAMAVSEEKFQKCS